MCVRGKLGTGHKKQEMAVPQERVCNSQLSIQVLSQLQSWAPVLSPRATSSVTSLMLPDPVPQCPHLENWDQLRELKRMEGLALSRLPVHVIARGHRCESI